MPDCLADWSFISNKVHHLVIVLNMFKPLLRVLPTGHSESKIVILRYIA